MTVPYSPAAIAASIAANLRAYSLLAGRTPGGRSQADGDVTWIATGTDALNRVLAANFPPHAAAARIKEVAAAFAGRPLTWITAPGDRPADLGRRLLDHGFKYLMPWRGMALALDGPPPAAATPAGLEIRPVRDPAGITAWGRTAAAGFAMPAGVGRDFPAVFASLATDKIAYFLGVAAKRPVATASVFLGDDGVAGAYFIATCADVRRRGIAAAMTRALISHAAGRGYRLLVLEASPAGYEVYRRLGFSQYCLMDAYTLNY